MYLRVATVARRQVPDPARQLKSRFDAKPVDRNCLLHLCSFGDTGGTPHGGHRTFEALPESYLRSFHAKPYSASSQSSSNSSARGQN